jgi:aspartate racemase
MKTIGLLGGMSWESSLEYYRIINDEVKRRLGGLHSAQCVLYSVDFAPLEEKLRAGDWDAIARTLAEAARRLEAAGAGLLLIATNTMHQVADRVQAALTVPLLHIADAAGAQAARQGMRRVALLGTRFTMERDFYRGRLRDGHGVETLVPGESERAEINRIIFDELCVGVFAESSRATLRGVIASLAARGAEGVVLGCTELPLIVRPADAPVPVLDTMRLHALAAVDAALAGT